MSQAEDPQSLGSGVSTPGSAESSRLTAMDLNDLLEAVEDAKLLVEDLRLRRDMLYGYAATLEQAGLRRFPQPNT